MASADTAPPAATAGAFHRIGFTGRASEYFGIWIVNVLLTILTLGIYSAWAKVRRNRYFYGNTVLLGRSFEYHARGLQILIGRLIVIGAVAVLNLVSILNPFLALLPAIAFLIALPWLVARGLRFSARVTSYRNVRFDFVGGPGGAFKAFILGSVIATLTLGILTPLASRWVARYVGANLRYGGKAFDTDPELGPLFKAWLMSAGVVVAVLAVVGGFVALNFEAVVDAIAGSAIAGQMTFSIWHYVILVVYIGFFVLFGVVGLFYRAAVRNIVWSATTFDGRHRLLSDMSRGRYIWIAVSNVIVTILTLGLMRPWAAVRLARYVYEHTGVTFVGDVGELFSAIEAQGSAVGAEFMDFEGFDFGF
ncbi:YjgN family protein [Shinella sumterensis]|uniref:YjgN family protein n=1 Tax=Shinella sumterensis TaxID=1967501 RepID=UPI003F853786